MKKFKKWMLCVCTVVLLVMVGYRLLFVQFEDRNMGKLLADQLGKTGSYFITTKDLEMIHVVDIGPTCNYDTIVDLAKCKNLKKLYITRFGYDRIDYMYTLRALDLLKINGTDHEYPSFSCDTSRERVEQFQEDLRVVFEKCVYIEVFSVGDISVSDWREVDGYNNERTPIQFTSIDFLKAGTNLKEVSLPYQKNIEDYSCMSTLLSIETVCINDNNIDDISFLNNNIKSLNISNTNISLEQLSEFNNLNHLVISPNQTEASNYINEDAYVGIVVADPKQYLDNAEKKDTINFEISNKESRNVLKRGASIDEVQEYFMEREDYFYIDKEDSIYPFFLGRNFSYKNVLVLYNESTGELLAINVYGDENVAICGISVGDSIETVFDILGQADGYGRTFDNGVLYEKDDVRLIIYFDILGTNVEAIELYFDEEAYELNELDPNEVARIVYYDEE